MGKAITQLKTFKTLFGVSKTGAIKVYIVSAEENSDGTANILISFGYEHGKKQTDIVSIKTGKNIGKKNETTPFQQACSEALSRWNNKKLNGYTETKNSISQVTLPMLAKSFKDMKHKITYPCLGQPKLNGIRCMARITKNGVEYISRKGKTYSTLVHLNSQLQKLFKDLEDTEILLDGEVYKHGWSLQKIAKHVKKAYPETKELGYVIFDISDTANNNATRNKYLEDKFRNINNKNYSNLSLIHSDIINSENEVKLFHDSYIRDGYEGIILRNLNGKYIYNYRSEDLQKYKEFIDKEFKIVSYKTGTGREEGAIVFICEISPNGPTFEVRPTGSIQARIDMAKNFNKIKGKLLTVRYQELSDSGIPTIVSGLVVRDYE